MNSENEKKTPEPISAKKLGSDIIPMIFEEMEELQENVTRLHKVIELAVGTKKPRCTLKSAYNPFNRYNLNYYENGLFFDNLLLQFDIDFLTNLRQSLIIKNELLLSDSMVFFAMFQEESCSDFMLRSFLKTGNESLKKLYELFEKFGEIIGTTYNEHRGAYVINNLNYLPLLKAIDDLNGFCIDSNKEDWISSNNIEMLYESYLNEKHSNHGIDTKVIYTLHRPGGSTKFKISIHTESYRFQSYIHLYVWSDTSKQWNLLLDPPFTRFHLDPTRMTAINGLNSKYADRIIKYCIDFSQDFI